MARYKLKLKQLDFVSLVDDPAQPNAKCLLIKRRDGVGIDLTTTARLVKASDELGLAFFWAFTSTNPDGSEHYDLHGDAVQADNDMIKAAAEFMEKGGAVDEMHDSEPDGGRVVFAMPMTPEIAKAFGVETKTSGLMIAIRPSADAMAKLKDGTYRAVSIAGLGERIEARKAAKVAKGSLYTNEVDGHQHRICVYEDGSMWVEHATMGGAEYSHSHGIVFENGQLTILADSGHSHELADGQAGVVVVPADAVVVVSASKSTRSPALPQAQTIKAKDHTMATEHDKQIADLTKRNERLERIAKMSGAHKAHFDTLIGDDADAFLAKTSAERDTIVQKALEDDKPVWTGEVTKVSVRRRDGELALQLAKQNEENAVALAKAREAQQTEVYKARVRTEIAHLAKGDDVKVAVLKALDGIADEKLRGEAIEMLKGADAMMKSLGTAPGFNPGSDPQPVTKAGAFEALSTGLMKFAAEKKIEKVWTEGLASFTATPEGKALADAYNASLK